MAISSFIVAAFLAQMVSLDATDMELSDFLRFMAKAANMNVVIDPAVQGKVNVMVKDAPWLQVLDLVLKGHGLGREIDGNTMRIAPVEKFPLQTQVYFLRYIRADEIAPIIAKTLSSSGSVATYPSRNAVIITDVRQ